MNIRTNCEFYKISCGTAVNKNAQDISVASHYNLKQVPGASVDADV